MPMTTIGGITITFTTDADSTLAQQKIAALRADLQSLQGKTIGVDTWESSGDRVKRETT